MRRVHASLVAAAIVALTPGCRDLERGSACLDRTCPVGTTCSEALGECLLDEQLDACAGLPDGAACSFSGVSDGTCYQGGCFVAGCGNGIVEPGIGDDDGEVCDDGNRLGGDGCSADCGSLETCGNGVIDQIVGEACDDGNTDDGDDCQANCALPRCGDGVLDGGEVCDDGNNQSGDGCNQQCTSKETCGNGVIDVIKGEQCDDGNTDTGDGCGATCKIEVCGNEIIDPGEVCDDGNTVGGDGCSPTCVSLETCGNGYIDAPAGEQCDDSNLKSHDGCSSGCTLENPQWEQLTDVVKPFGVEFYDRIMAYDISRDRVVAYLTRSQQTFEFDGASWVEVHTEHAPDPRDDTTLVYHAGMRKLVLHGGVVPGTEDDLGDTWVYDGRDWTELVTTTTPTTVDAPVLAYDGARDELLRYGVNGSLESETWVLSGGDWVQRFPDNSPPPAYLPGLAYDPGRGTVVLAGGLDFALAGFGFPFYDTWEWDGSDWSFVDSTAPEDYGTMVYDEAGARLLFNDGSDLFEWSGAGWSSLVGIPAGSDMTYDVAGERLILVGPTSGSNPHRTHQLKGTSVTELTLGVPPSRYGGAGIYDPRRGGLVVFGGETGIFSGAYRNRMWEFVGGVWNRRSLRHEFPVASLFMTAAYDTDAGVCRAVARNGASHDVFDNAGAGWAQQSPITPKPYENDSIAGLIYDPGRQVSVAVFSGGSSISTWEYDGTTWTDIGIEPPGAGVLAYDPPNHRTLWLASGGDLWEYDPDVPSWKAVATTGTPPPLVSGWSWVYSPVRESLIVWGGNGTSYELEDGRWSEIFVPLAPPDRNSPQLVHDPLRGTIVMHGGYPKRDTWELSWRSGYPDESCDIAGDDDGDGLADCADPDCDGKSCGAGGLRCAAGTCACPGGSAETSCGDDIDDDCDGLVDCADDDCAASGFCTVEADCADGIDNDDDFLVDCAEPECAGVGICEAFESSCGDGEDNDGDGRTDCQDVDCYLVACPAVTP